MITLLDVYHGPKQRPTPGAVELLYDLLLERPAHANISHKEMPTHAQHEAFVKSRPYRHWFFVLNDYSQRVGALYLTKNNELGIFIFKKYQRQGYALEAIREAVKIPPILGLPSTRNSHYLANVAPQNEASHQLFTKLGARAIQVTYELP